MTYRPPQDDLLPVLLPDNFSLQQVARWTAEGKL
jgi:hypothetical protein